MPNINFQISDTKFFECDIKLEECSLLVKILVDNLGLEEEGQGPEEAGSLPKMNSSTLRHVMTWAAHHKDDVVSDKVDENTKEHFDIDNISAWDVEFFAKFDSKTMRKIMFIANCMGMKRLADMAYTIVMNKIKVKMDMVSQLIEIDHKLNIENDVYLSINDDD